MSAAPTALVTGAGRGIGRAAVEALAAAGWRVVAGVRDLPAAEEAFAGLEGVRVVALDVTDAAQVAAAVDAAQEHAGGALAGVVCNAGHAVLGAIEDADLDAVRAMFETNFYGAAAVIQRALPAMREAGRGRVVISSSIGARLSNPLVGMYHASKYALLALAEALALETRPFGIRVCLIEPGMVDTDFPRATRPIAPSARGEGPYAPLLAGLRRGFGAWRESAPTPATVPAAAIVAALTDPDPPFRVLVGQDAVDLAAMRDRAADDRAFQDDLARFLLLDWPPGPAA